MDNKNPIIEAKEDQIKKFTSEYQHSLSDGRVIDLKYYDNEDWLIQRSISGIGASEIATALGKVPAFFSKTPLKLWKEKTGHIIEVLDTPILRIGRGVEETIVNEYEYLTGRQVERVKNIMFIHPKLDFLFADLDGIILPAGGDGYGILECKSTNSYVYDSWKDKLPTYYFRQAMAELSVINNHPYYHGESFDYVDFATLLLDKREVEILRIYRDDEFIEQQNKEISDWFQSYVIANVPPPETAAEWSKTEPMSDSYIVATPDIYKKFSEFMSVKKQKKDLEDKEQALKDEIILAIQDNESLVYEGEVIATYKQQKKETVDSKKLKADHPDIYDGVKKISSFRVLRTKEIESLNY